MLSPRCSPGLSAFKLLSLRTCRLLLGGNGCSYFDLVFHECVICGKLLMVYSKSIQCFEAEKELYSRRHQDSARGVWDIVASLSATYYSSGIRWLCFALFCFCLTTDGKRRWMEEGRGVTMLHRIDKELYPTRQCCGEQLPMCRLICGVNGD